MGLLSCIKKKLANAIEKNCSERTCQFKCDGIGTYVILKGEKVRKDGKMCDCVIFSGESSILVVVVELKGRTAHSSEIVKKLENGSRSALKILKTCGKGYTNATFYPIVLAKKWTSSEYRVISRTKLRVSGIAYNVIAKRCGVSFAQLISEVG